ncbi:unnamed protein product [Ilex paraguariensis]|uniref:Uncharacterized protein n=1 Tax=Ilex paraguariensis TaxID=185542 RepID=A0ABC8TR41_9AQUA
MSAHAWEFVDGVSFDIRVPLMSTVPRNFGAEDMTCDQALVISMVESHRRSYAAEAQEMIKFLTKREFELTSIRSQRAVFPPRPVKLPRGTN